jgi:hypothetical protein
MCTHSVGPAKDTKQTIIKDFFLPKKELQLTAVWRNGGFSPPEPSIRDGQNMF